MQRYGAFGYASGDCALYRRRSELWRYTPLGAALFWLAVAWLSWKRRWLVVAALVLLSAFPTHLFCGLSPAAGLMVSAAASRLILICHFRKACS